MRTNFGDHFAARSDEFFPAKLEVGLRQIMADDHAAGELGRWSREQVRAHYDLAKIADQVDAVYRETV
jgi:hypothetical protein